MTVVLLPDLQPLMPPVPDVGLEMGLMVASEVITGLWFGWVVRMIALALPIAAQLIGLLIGLSSVLQPDPELGAQSSALGKLFEMAVPTLLLLSGLYKLSLLALVGLFSLIPPGHIVPAAESLQIATHSVTTSFSLALQLASPFVVVSIAWNIAMGLISRVAGRLQLHFISMPGQILVGLGLLILSVSIIVEEWDSHVRDAMNALPGMQ